MKGRIVAIAGVGVLLGVAAPSRLQATTPESLLGLDFIWGVATDGFRADMPFTVGWTFSVTSDIYVTDLGFWDATGPGHNHNSHSVGLWTESGTLLTSQSVSINSPLYTSSLGTSFHFQSIQPVELSAGQTYRIGAEYTAELYLDFYVYALTAPVSASPSILYGNAAESPANAGLAFPSVVKSSTEGLFGPNFKYTLVPEPTTFTLLGLGSLVLVVPRRRKSFSQQ